MKMESNNKNAYIMMDQVTKNYKDPSSKAHFQALRGIDLQIRKNSLTTIVGPSGAGKSTLLNILGGLISPSTGRIFVDNLPIHNFENGALTKYRRNLVGFLWQLPERNLLRGLSIRDNILQKMALTGYPNSKRKARVDELLEAVGLTHRSKHHLNKLSGGEAQRAGIAVAMANDPQIVLADEPTGELDTETTNEVIDFIKSIQKESGTTFVVVTHDTRFEKMSDQTFQIIDGVISGFRRSTITHELHKSTIVEKEELIPVSQLGMIKIPAHILKKYKISKNVVIHEHSDCNGFCIHPDEREVDQ